jgi:hypothetical protein
MPGSMNDCVDDSHQQFTALLPLCGLVARVLATVQRLGFDSLCYQIFWEVVGLERDALSLVSTVEELLERKSSGSGLESWEYGRGDLSRWTRDTLYPQKLALLEVGGYFTTDGQSVCISWCRAPLWGPWPDFTFSFLLPENCFALRPGAPSLAIGWVCNL